MTQSTRDAEFIFEFDAKRQCFVMEPVVCNISVKQKEKKGGGSDNTGKNIPLS